MVHLASVSLFINKYKKHLSCYVVLTILKKVMAEVEMLKITRPKDF